MGKQFEVLEHTADMGLRAFGRELADVYANAGRGMLSLLVERSDVRPVLEESLDVAADDAVSLLVKWLHEILYRFEVSGTVYCDVKVEALSRWRIRGMLVGERFDPARHRLGAEIKAVTWHAARVERVGDGYEADVFFDV